MQIKVADERKKEEVKIDFGGRSSREKGVQNFKLNYTEDSSRF